LIDLSALSAKLDLRPEAFGSEIMLIDQPQFVSMLKIRLAIEPMSYFVIGSPFAEAPDLSQD